MAGGRVLAFAASLSTLRESPSINPFSPGLKRGRVDFKGTRKEASDLLRSAAVSLVSRGQVRGGYLRLTQGRNGLTLGTNLFKRTQSTDQARDVLCSMIKTAYSEHAGIEAAIDTYIGQSSQRLGTQSFVKLIQALDAQTCPIPNDPNTEVIARAKPKQNARLQSDTFGSASSTPRGVRQPGWVLLWILRSASPDRPRHAPASRSRCSVTARSRVAPPTNRSPCA
jgi:hypothetical protein